MKQLLKGLVFMVGILILAGCNILTYENDQTFTLDAVGLDSLIVNHQEGDVRITGVEGLEEVIVHATFVSMSDDMDKAIQFNEDNIDISLTSDDTTGLLSTKIIHGAVHEQGYLHLNIEIPAHIKINYRQNEGELKVKSMKANMDIHHGSNSLVLEDIEGDVKIVDGADKLFLSNIKGNITLNKGSGSINISEATGDLMVIAGSGNIKINDQNGDITIRSGSGSVSIQHVLGDVTVLENRSGELELTDIAGVVTKP